MPATQHVNNQPHTQLKELQLCKEAGSAFRGKQSSLEMSEYRLFSTSLLIVEPCQDVWQNNDVSYLDLVLILHGWDSSFVICEFCQNKDK